MATQLKGSFELCCAHCEGSFMQRVKLINLRLKEVQIHTLPVEGTAQTNLSPLLPFWITEE